MSTKYVYLTSLPMLAATQQSRIAHLTSFLEVTIKDNVYQVPKTLFHFKAMWFKMSITELSFVCQYLYCLGHSEMKYNYNLKLWLNIFFYFKIALKVCMFTHDFGLCLSLWNKSIIKLLQPQDLQVDNYKNYYW